jgi:hypothetical protein
MTEKADPAGDDKDGVKRRPGPRSNIWNRTTVWVGGAALVLAGFGLGIGTGMGIEAPPRPPTPIEMLETRVCPTPPPLSGCITKVRMQLDPTDGESTAEQDAVFLHGMFDLLQATPSTAIPSPSPSAATPSPSPSAATTHSPSGA